MSQTLDRPHSQPQSSPGIKQSTKPGVLPPPPPYDADVRQAHWLSYGPYITKINSAFFRQQMSQLCLLPLFLKLRSYLKCASKSKLKSVITMAGEEGFQDGHQEPGTCSSQRGRKPRLWYRPSQGRSARPSHAQGLKSGHPLLLPFMVLVSKLFGLESEETTAFSCFIHFIHTFLQL